MTTTSPTRPAVASAVARPVTLVNSIRSEWVKFHGLTSNLVLTGFTLLLLIGNGAAMPWAYVFRDRGSAQADYDAYPEMVIDKTGYVGVLLAILGALVVANEYRSGQIKTTMLSVPRRTHVLVAKATTVGTVSFLVGLISAAISLTIAPPILATAGYGYELAASDAVRLILGSGLYLATLAVIGIAIGALVRNVVASVLGVLGLLLVMPVIPQMFSDVGGQITAYFPIQAGFLLLAPPEPHTLGPWIGYLVLAGWAIVLFLVAAVVLSRRDT